MSKKKRGSADKRGPEPDNKSGASPEEKTAADYYDLKLDAVERLVDASDAPQVSDEEIRKYTKRGKFRIPPTVKILFIKFWFSGAVCYFFLWGLGIYIQGLDLMAALAIGLGVVTDLMANKLLRHFEPEERAYDKWMMVTARQFWSIFVNVLYAGVVLFCVSGWIPMSGTARRSSWWAWSRYCSGFCTLRSICFS